MRRYILVLLILSSISSMAQPKYIVNIVGAYQFYDKQSIYLGASRSQALKWPDWGIDLQMMSSMFGEKYIADSEIDNIYAVGFNFLIGIPYAYIGFNERMSFQEGANRVDFGPMLRVGYKYVWLEYSRNFLGFENLFNKSSTQKVNLDKIESNLKLVVTIPIFRKT